MAYAQCNGLVTYLTSLASRRAAQLGGEHLHRLFCISVKKLPATELAKEAFSKLENDLKRKMFLEQLQVLIVEEVSLIQAELWATIDLLLQFIKGNELPFGGVLVIANGDCCQCPNVSGYDVFQSCSLLFTTEFHFLNEFVRMHDPHGKEVLQLLEERPVAPASIDRICELLLEHCQFHDSWDTVDNKMIMKVFGKKSAERQSLMDHETNIRDTGAAYSIATSTDEMCVSNSNVWRLADNNSTISLLNKKCREPKNLILYDRAVLRLTRNCDHSSQGDLFVLDYHGTTDSTLSVYKAPNQNLITRDNLTNGLYKQWSKFVITRGIGFSVACRTGCVRRIQFPFCNYVALTVHKLMGDTFPNLATSISASENKYSLWLTSQIYVIISRVRHLSSLHFVGGKTQIKSAIVKVLSTKHHHEESIYNFMKQLKNNKKQSAATHVPCTAYLRNHFEVPATANGFVFLLVSMIDKTFTTFIIEETNKSLSDTLRLYNSTKDDSLLTGQPWAMGYFIWHFTNDTERHQCRYDLQRLSNLRTKNFTTFAEETQKHVDTFYPHLYVCITGQVINIDRID